MSQIYQELKTMLLKEVDGFDVVNDLAEHVFWKYGRRLDNLIHLIKIQFVDNGTGDAIIRHIGMKPGFQERPIRLTAEQVDAIYDMYKYPRFAHGEGRMSFNLDIFIEKVNAD